MVIAPRGARRVQQILAGKGMDHITFLLAASASGTSIAPMLIFKGKQFRNTWMHQDHLPGLLVGRSDNGWINADVLLEWLKKFISLIGPDRPVLLYTDGHITREDIRVIDLCSSNGITLFRLPSHATHLLQPLDLTVMGLFKRVREGSWILHRIAKIQEHL